MNRGLPGDDTEGRKNGEKVIFFWWLRCGRVAPQQEGEQRALCVLTGHPGGAWGVAMAAAVGRCSRHGDGR